MKGNKLAKGNRMEALKKGSRLFKSGVVLILILTMLLSIFAGCGKSNNDGGTKASDNSSVTESADNADKVLDTSGHLSFTVYSLDDHPNMMDWPLVKEAMEKFNFDFKIQQVAWDSWDETTRTLVATNSLPEVVTWYNLIYGEYLDWAKQGVFKAFPDDLSPYPNLKKLVETNSIFDQIKVNGHLYAFPKISNSNPWSEYMNFMFIYRKDWAKAIGKDYADLQVMTWDELVGYLKEIKEKDPGKLGDTLIPLDFVHGGMSWINLLSMQFNPYAGSFQNSGGQYIWGSEQTSSIEGLKKINELYKQGLVYRDSYMDSMGAGSERFIAGRSAVFFTPATPPQFQQLLEGASKEANLTVQDYGMFMIKQPDGKFKVAEEHAWWAAFAFSSACRDEVMNRWLAVGDWLLETEQIEKSAYGVYGEDWTREGDTIKLNWDANNIPDDKKYIIDQKNIFQKFFILEGLDVFLPGNPAVNTYAIDLYKKMFDTFDSNPDFTPTDYDVAYFSSENYNANATALSADLIDAVIQSVIADDPEKTWSGFLDAKRSNAQICIDELNAAFK